MCVCVCVCVTECDQVIKGRWKEVNRERERERERQQKRKEERKKEREKKERKREKRKKERILSIRGSVFRSNEVHKNLGASYQSWEGERGALINLRVHLFVVCSTIGWLDCTARAGWSSVRAAAQTLLQPNRT